MTPQQMIEELKNLIRHPSPMSLQPIRAIPSAQCLYNPWHEHWYTDQSLRCMYPDLGRTVGYAVTCTYGLPDPNFNRLSFMDVLEALDAMPKPTILVLQQNFPLSYGIRSDCPEEI